LNISPLQHAVDIVEPGFG